jgi:osmotically-inducible protein OsmY
MFRDHELKEDVLAEFRWEPSLTSDHIEVTANRGVITLTGQVPHFPEKSTAEQAAMRVKGVKAVVQELEVRLPDTMTRDDQDIARAALDRLSWETGVPADLVKIKVEKGWVTLSGQVPWHYQRDAAERTISGLIGVLGVANHVTVKPHANAANIGQDIDVALHRSWFDPRTISVSAVGGRVTLSGNVHTPAERWTAGRTAWAAPGATEVENDLIVVG